MKIGNTLKAAYLLLKNTSTFSPEKIFKGKRVAIIGAANTAFEERNGAYIDDFDLVVRVNKAVHVWQPEDATFVGKRTDVLFHSFFENEYSGGGPIDFELFQERGVKFLVNPHRSVNGLVAHLNFYKRHPEAEQTYLLDWRSHQILKDSMKKWTPTIGFAALASVLNSSCAEVFISGFTFFKTPYAKGYRDHFLSPEVNEAHMKKQGIHNPELEYRNFLNILNNRNCSKFNCDRALTEIMESER